MQGVGTEPSRGQQPERWAGWCGIGMVVAIVINGPLSMAMGRIPNYWTPDADERIAEFLAVPGNVTQSVTFFALSNLIFVFAIGFFAGLRHLADRIDDTGWTRGVVTIGAALFLAGGLLSETLSTGIAVVLQSTPAYELDVNATLLLQGLWSTAIAQAQVALGVLAAVISVGAVRRRVLPGWLGWLGVVAGIVTILRPAIVTEVPVFIATMQPLLVWVAAISVLLARTPRAPGGLGSEAAA